MQSLFRLALSAALIVSGASLAHAQSSAHSHDHGGTPARESALAGTAMSEGEVKKVDKETGKLALKHGELKNLGMPPMTMVFHVSDKALLDGVKPGDTISFVAEKVNGKFTVMQISRPR